MLFVSHSVAAQIRGMVRDSVTQEVMSYVSVYYADKGVGQYTDDKGRYELPTRPEWTELIFSAIGYKTKHVKIIPGETKKLDIDLVPENIMLKELVVKPKREHYRKKDNPAVALMRKVIASKDNNDLKNNDFYRFNKYEKMTMAFDDVKSESLEKGIWKKMPFLKNQLEINEESGKLVLPISVRETVSEQLYRKSPEQEKTIVKGINSSGLDNLFDLGDFIDDVIDNVFADINIYDNGIYLLGKKFVSPIADGAISFYKYYIMDTVYVERDKCIHLTFVPQNSQDLGFTGHIYIMADSSYIVRRCTMNLPKNTGVNFVDDLSLTQDYTKASNGNMVLVVDDMSTEIYPFKDLQGAIVRRVTRYSGYSFDPIPDSDFRSKRSKETMADAHVKDSSFWEEHRQLPLTGREETIDEFVDNVQNTPGAKYIIWLMRLMAENYVETTPKDVPNKINLGPLSTVLSSNYVDGLRVRLGMTTIANLNPHLFFNGYVAYGFKDSRFKYSGEVEYSFEKKLYMPFEYPVHSISLSYQSDVMSPLDKFLQMDKDNVFNSFRTSTIDQMMYYRKGIIKYEYESFSGFSTKVELRHNIEEPTGKLQYIRNDGLGTAVSHLTTAEIGVTLRYAPGEEYVNTKQRRRPVNRNAPVFILAHTVGISGVLGSDYHYHLTEASIYKRLWLGSWGRMDMKITAAAQWSKVPFPLLIMPPSNSSYFLQRESFNLLNNMEFLNDRYASIDLDYDMNGKLFNRIPLLRRLKWREHLGFKAFYGTLTNKNNPNLQQDGELFLFPMRDGIPSSFMMDSHKPYAEFIVGIHNIFRILRVDYVRRLNYLDHPDISKDGIRVSFKIQF